ncbi:MAG: hypothetical protein GC134_03760 [Proteobacteria bacterium]|nr:hypothetical protein [Pseudomonadota bacterium]
MQQHSVMPEGPIVFYALDHTHGEVKTMALGQGGTLTFHVYKPEIKLTSPMQSLEDLVREKTADAPYAIEDAELTHLFLTLDTRFKDHLDQARMLEPSTEEAAKDCLQPYEKELDTIFDAVMDRMETSDNFRAIADGDPLMEVETHHRTNRAFSAYYQTIGKIREGLCARATRKAELAELDFEQQARDTWAENGLDPDDMPELRYR